MSTNKVEELEGADEVCACCGIAAGDDVKLKNCACNLVKYCTVDCQKNHRSRHKKACKKRLAELHDKQLFTQPDSNYLGECPICCLPLSIDLKKSILMSCCCKILCKGCNYANQMRELEEGLEQRCAFCREPAAEMDDEEFFEKNIMERVKKNDAVAMTQMGKTHLEDGDYEKAVEYFTKAAKLGDANAHCCLGDLYRNGNGVEKDEKKAIFHFEQAAIGGHPFARGNLAEHELRNGRPDRAVKHVIIGANLGCNNNLKFVKDLFVEGITSKEDYAAALHGYQTAVNETKNAEREEGEAFYAKMRS